VSDLELAMLTPVYFAELAEAQAVNQSLLAAYMREKVASDVRRTHHFMGRFENTYIPHQRIPELEPVARLARRAAAQVLGLDALRQGFWFNEMAPGQRTSLHSHEEDDELLSGVYYIVCPDHSGRLLLHDDEALVCVTPRPGLLVLFPPNLPHEVEENASGQTRLSVAFNFGPAGSAT